MEHYKKKGPSKNFSIEMRKKHISRKKNIVKKVWGAEHLSEEDIFFKKLSKNKIHCSCPLCSNKSKRDGYKPKDIKKINKIENDLMDYYLNK